MSREKVIELAKADLGYAESPANSNKTKYGEWYGVNGVPWCVQALAYWFNQAGERMAFFGGGKTASCSTLLRWYREQGLTVPVEDVQVGDIVLLNFNGKGTADHCGIVVDTYGDAVFTIEGNTTPGLEGSQDNGGSVALKQRESRQMVAVCRPMYQADAEDAGTGEGPHQSASLTASPEGKPSPGGNDISGHWAETSIRKAVAKGVMQGYPDGTWLPDRDVTRAELAVILDRLGLLG